MHGDVGAKDDDMIDNISTTSFCLFFLSSSFFLLKLFFWGGKQLMVIKVLKGLSSVCGLLPFTSSNNWCFFFTKIVIFNLSSPVCGLLPFSSL